MYTITQLGRRHGLSRTALLYYERIGLLAASARSVANYRLYDEDQAERLERICTYRKAGLPLKEIAAILGRRGSRSERILKRHLDRLNGEIRSLRRQQEAIVALLRDGSAMKSTRLMDKQRWSNLLRAAGLDDEGMWRWHVAFERSAPEAHQDFLESLRLPADEIRAIRERSAAGAGAGAAPPGAHPVMPQRAQRVRTKRRT